MSITILHVVISEKVNRSNRTASVTWNVPTRQPLLTPWQAGDLSQKVGTDVAQTCELCFYTGGVVGELIDLSLSPEALGLTRANAVYLRPLQHTSLGKLGGMSSLTHEEVRRLNEDAKRLAEVLLPRLKPDDPCPVCSHSRNERGGAGGRGVNDSYSNAGGRGGGGVDAGVGGSPRGGGGGSSGGVGFKYKPSQAVQCGIASGIDQPPILIEFGKTGARMQAAEKDSAVLTAGGGNARRSDKDIINDLQMTIEDLKVKNTAQAVEIKEARRELKALEQWKTEHRCETNTNVGALRMQIEVLQENLRELMRGRQEVFAILQERRKAGGGMLKDTPYNYTPFATSLPELTYVDPHTLLSKADDPSVKSLVDRHAKLQKMRLSVGGVSVSGTGNTQKEALLKEQRDRDYNNPLATINADILKRPSADGGLNDSAALNSNGGLYNYNGNHGNNSISAAQYAEEQKRRETDIEICGQNCLPGHCQLRINTTGGEPFIVQRKIGSHILHGKNLITLMSLDGIVTDEIFVEELEMVAAPGRCGLVLATRSFEWKLSFSPQERTNWMQWLYALNPWLTPNRPANAALMPSH